MRIMAQFLNATSGEILCGEEIAPKLNPDITETSLPPD